jgi:tripartite-type tricarboxylate transporter receptor subunit TctC
LRGGRTFLAQMANPKLSRRKFLHLAAGAAALSAMPRISKAQAYPAKPVRIIVPFAAGGSTDIAGRIIAQWLSERFGQQFVVENRPGAGSNVGTEAVLKAPPDGHTLVLLGPGNAINATLYERLNFNLLRDSEPVAGLMSTTLVMEVHPSLPVASVPAFIAYAKANPGRISMASAGIGSGTHMAGELFRMMTGLELVHVPYRGEGPAVADLLGGQIQFMFSTLTVSIEYVKAGRVRALAVTSAARWPTLPDLPAVAESMPGYEVTPRFGLAAPRNTPAEIVERLNREVAAGLDDPKVKARLADLGSEPMPATPAAYRKLLSDEVDKWAKVVRFSGARPE